jgi:hypothetical protein
MRSIIIGSICTCVVGTFMYYMGYNNGVQDQQIKIGYTILNSVKDVYLKGTIDVQRPFDILVSIKDKDRENVMNLMSTTTDENIKRMSIKYPMCNT